MKKTITKSILLFFTLIITTSFGYSKTFEKSETYQINCNSVTDLEVHNLTQQSFDASWEIDPSVSIWIVELKNLTDNTSQFKQQLENTISYDNLTFGNSYELSVRSNICSAAEATTIVIPLVSDCDGVSEISYSPKADWSGNFEYTDMRNLKKQITWENKAVQKWEYKIASNIADLDFATLHETTETLLETDTLTIREVYYMALRPVCLTSSGEWLIDTLNATDMALPNDLCDSATSVTTLPFIESETGHLAENELELICSGGGDYYRGDRFYKITPERDGSISASILSNQVTDVALAYVKGTCEDHEVIFCDWEGFGYGEGGRTSAQVGFSNLEALKGESYYIVVLSSFGYESLDLFIDGTNVVGLENETTTINTLAYPNPCKDIFSLNTETTGKLIIQNELGQTITEQNITKSQNQIAVSNMNKGVYILKFIDDSGIITTDKLLVE